MSFFYKEQKFTSAKNGELIYKKFWDGSWLLKIPAGEYYSSSYLEKMWKSQLKKITKLKIINILILGGGAGCAVDQASKFFPEAKIQVIDYDQSIMEIGKKIYKNFVKNPNLTFITAEAQNFVDLTNNKYDLVLIDLFVENNVSALIKNFHFLHCLENISLPEAVIITNSASWLTKVDQEIFTNWSVIFPQAKMSRFKSNKLIVVKKGKKL